MDDPLAVPGLGWHPARKNKTGKKLKGSLHSAHFCQKRLWPVDAALVEQPTLLQPESSGILVRADEEHLLDRTRGVKQALQARVGGILQLETAGVPLAHLDTPGHNTAHLLATLKNGVADLIETEKSPVLAFDPSKFHLACLYSSPRGASTEIYRGKHNDVLNVHTP